MPEYSDVVRTARRRLRRIRIRDAIGESISPDEEESQRNNLLSLVLSALATHGPSSDQLEASVIDAGVSVALARVTESALDRVAVLLPSAELLARDQQFARLRQLSAIFRDARDDLRSERPFLAVTLDAVQHHLAGRERAAERRLAQAIGFDKGAERPRVQRSIESLLDLYIAAGVHNWLTDGDTSDLSRAREFALGSSEPSALETAEFFLSYTRSVDDARLTKVLHDAPGWPAKLNSDAYLQRRGVLTLFPAQIQAIAAGALRPGSAVVAMPTSSGKTFLAELRIVAAIANSSGRRVIYLAPYRLLSRQVEAELRNGLRNAGLRARDVGSTFDVSVEEDAEFPDIAIMTPERLDALLRLSMSSRRGADEAAAFLESVDLVVFDEIHLVGRPGRGPRLELLLTRWRDRYPNADLLALSGVVEGAGNVAEWLGAEAITGGRRPTGTIELLWRTDGSLVQRFDNRRGVVTTLARNSTAIGDAAHLALRVRPDLRPVLILENTRPNAESVARRVREGSPRNTARWREGLAEEDRARLEAAASEAEAAFGSSHDLPDLLRDGIAYHHAGVPGHILRLIEDLASRRILQVVSATTTVAEGAHLPFQVVIIPHLNFQGGGGRLDKSLYLNVLGRAGRAGVSVEGIVIVLDSDSRTLKGYVLRTLWNEQERIRVRGRLASVPAVASTMEDIDVQRSVESQVLAWLGEDQRDSDDQAGRLASSTFSGKLSTNAQRSVARVVDRTLRSLEERGLARAASPYQLTESGRRARLAGLGAFSCMRLREAVSLWDEDWIGQLAGVPTLDQSRCDVIAATLFEAEEVLENGLWFRRSTTTETARTGLVRSLRSGRRSWPYGDDLYEVDTAVLSAWIMGRSYEELGTIPPEFQRGLFAGSDTGSRAADAAELVGRLSYPASWTWAAVVAMLGQAGELLPFWLRRSIEYGVPSRVAVEIIDRVGLTRSSAVALSSELADSWDHAAEQLQEMASEDLPASMTDNDVARLVDWQGAEPF